MSLRARIQRVSVVLWLVVFAFNISSLSFAQPPQVLTISHGKEVSLEYTLRLADKKIVDTNVSAEPLVFTQGSMQIIPGLEKRLEGMAVGQEKQVVVTPEEGYGPVNQCLARAWRSSSAGYSRWRHPPARHQKPG